MINSVIGTVNGKKITLVEYKQDNPYRSRVNIEGIPDTQTLGTYMKFTAYDQYEFTDSRFS